MQTVGGAAAGKFSSGSSVGDINEGVSRIPGVIDATNEVINENETQTESATKQANSGNAQKDNNVQRSSANGIDTVSYEGLYGQGQYVIKNGSDTIRQRPSGSRIFYRFNDRTGN